ncbi:hypothetical protein EUGRSUZ_K03217 [Eucalyptus grandis]|uniref:Uncharacterized protein n=2 Tax=Eucalyptus grandis TaxID=71139 RepID=A0ACC3IZV3_EUCGR|nr:hypothetical protein EUGRSUZ_K03217 [Eucalyptus grandis]
MKCAEILWVIFTARMSIDTNTRQKCILYTEVMTQVIRSRHLSNFMNCRLSPIINRVPKEEWTLPIKSSSSFH